MDQGSGNGTAGTLLRLAKLAGLLAVTALVSIAPAAARHKVQHRCGTASGTYTTTIPIAGLCRAGLPNNMSSAGPPWTWECVGMRHHPAQCATLASPATNLWTPVGPGWVLTFDDEFNGTAVDTTRWGIPDGTPDHNYSTYSNAVFAAANISVANGFAGLAVTKTASGYATAAMTSSFLQTYGYWEARVRPPCHAVGVGAGFWLDAQGWTFPEIDIMEWLGAQPGVDHKTWHYAYPQDGSNALGISTAVSNIDFCGSFHVIGAWWQPNSITWYIDGAQVAQTGTAVDSQNAAPLWVILDATVGGWGFNYIDDATQFPALYLIDYVHVYSNAPDAVAVTPDPGYGGPGDAVGSGY